LVAALVAARMNGRTRLHRDGLVVTVCLIAVLSFTVGVLIGRAVW
jgi:hypothetical protein